VRFTKKDNFGDAFRILREAINSDLVWVRAHTRLLVRATEWNKKDRDSSQLLRGSELSEAEQWLGKEKLEPELTPLQRQYIIASRADTYRNQKLKLAYVTASLIVSLVLFGAAVGLFFYARHQAGIADEQAKLAGKQAKLITEDQVRRAQDQINRAKEQADLAIVEGLKATEQAKESKRLTTLAEQRRLQAQAAQQDALRKKAFAEAQQRLTGKAVNETIDLVMGDVESPEEMNRLAQTYVKQGDYKTAEHIYRLIVLSVGAGSLESDNPRVLAGYYVSYARVLRHLGQLKEAANLDARATEILAEHKKP
jgi:hypothetical protein